MASFQGGERTASTRYLTHFRLTLAADVYRYTALTGTCLRLRVTCRYGLPRSVRTTLTERAISLENARTLRIRFRKRDRCTTPVVITIAAGFPRHCFTKYFIETEAGIVHAIFDVTL